MEQNIQSGAAGQSQLSGQSSKKTTSGVSTKAAGKIYCYTCNGKISKHEPQLSCMSCKHTFHNLCARYGRQKAAQIEEYYCDDCYRDFNCITIWKIAKGARRQRCSKLTKSFEVEAILDHRIIDDRMQYLIRWKDGPRDQATWETEHSCRDAPELINRYRRNLDMGPKLPYPTKVGLPKSFIDTDEILERVAYLREAKKLQSTAKVAVLGSDTTEPKEGTIYILDYNGHRYAIQRRLQKIYVCDGTNRYILTKNGRIREHFQKRFKNYQLCPIRHINQKQDNCGVALILIILGMLEMDSSGNYRHRLKYSNKKYEDLKNKLSRNKKKHGGHKTIQKTITKLKTKKM